MAEGSLDLAIAWIEEADVERHNLAAHLLWYERLEAVMPRAHRATHESVPAAEVTVLVDVDEASWWSWNRYAAAFAEANQVRVTNIDDGGIAGPAFSTMWPACGGRCSIHPSATQRRCRRP